MHEHDGLIIALNGAWPSFRLHRLTAPTPEAAVPTTHHHSELPEQIRSMIDEAIDIEVAGSADPGGYTNDPKDPGGETRWGVTAQVWRDHGYQGPIPKAPRRLAVEIFANKYVRAPGFLDVARRSLEIASELVEAGINLGPDRPSRWFQRVLNIMNVNANLYPDIGVDGDVGRETLEIGLDGYLRSRDPRVITMQLNHLQGAEYQRLAEARPSFERFVYGWLRQRTHVVEIPGKLRDAHLEAA